jgi:hypothetical protein
LVKDPRDQVVVATKFGLISHGCSPRATTSAPIPGTRRVTRVEETHRRRPRAHPTQLARLNALTSAAGERPSEANMARVKVGKARYLGASSMAAWRQGRLARPSGCTGPGSAAWLRCCGHRATERSEAVDADHQRLWTDWLDKQLTAAAKDTIGRKDFLTRLSALVR